MKPRPPQLSDRTPSAHSRCVTQGVWCFERSFTGDEHRPPVRLVVFDWDETLTLSTFLPGDKELRNTIGWCQWAEYITLHNFETPFVKSKNNTRVQKLHSLFTDLRNEEGYHGDGGPRKLAILTRNNQGAVACLNLLNMAGLGEHFSAIWCMAKVHDIPNGVYRGTDDVWHTFTAPLESTFDHKADVLVEIAANPMNWFPQFSEPGSPSGYTLEEIVLVDDVRNNFQSQSAARHKVLRYCKVARYDCSYRDMGFKSDMGGIGAKTDKDYNTLIDFVKQPWEYKAMLKARCVEKPFESCDEEPRVKLVVFDFDETLTLHTWLPEDTRIAKEIGYLGSEHEQKHFAEYNFASPYTDEDRIAALGKVLRSLATGPEDNSAEDGCVLAVLTQNEAGAIVVLNLLMMAGLDSHFSAIWAAGGTPTGVFRTASGEWRPFSPPLGGPECLAEHRWKVDVLKAATKTPRAFFPQLEGGADPVAGPLRALLEELTMAHIVLVDDEPETFKVEEAEVDPIVRYCEVTHYEDDNFRDQGLITHMGGLGAKRAEDYIELHNFVTRPWTYRETVPFGVLPGFGDLSDDERPDEGQVKLERRHTEDELDMDKSLRHGGLHKTLESPIR